METDKITSPNPFRHAMKAGLALGVAILLLFVCMTIPQGWTSFVIPLLMAVVLVMVYRMAKHYRETECGGSITYGQAFSYILILFFFASLVAAVLRYGYLEYINTTYLTDSFNQAMLIYEQLQIELPTEVVDEMRRIMVPTRFTMQFIMVDCMVGMFVALIYAFFVRKKQQDNESLTNNI